ncbi:MAG: hypothetical protein M1347_01750 [Chloroflexi bacterium]|nr:hypothetical protein [Chloroflexota bacterium]
MERGLNHRNSNPNENGVVLNSLVDYFSRPDKVRAAINIVGGFIVASVSYEAIDNRLGAAIGTLIGLTQHLIGMLDPFLSQAVKRHRRAEGRRKK